MSTGLFPIRQTEAGRRRRQTRGPSLTDHIAERLSMHGDIARAAAQLGRSASWGRQQFRAICAALGWQAQ
jgi:hypothetical protein